MTLSNRISRAGAIPLLVAVAIAVLVAIIALAPTRPASAAPAAGNCNLSPMLLDMLLARYKLESYQCNSLDISGDEATLIRTDTNTGGRYTLADGEKADTWDFSGDGLNSFAISDDDVKILQVLTDADATDTAPGPTVEAPVRYIDLTDNPLTADDVDFKNIPKNVAVILSAESNITGFQAAEYRVTEGSAGYVSVAFPNLIPDGQSSLALTVTLSGDATADRSDALGTGNTTQLIDFGTTGTASAFNEADDATREFVANSEAEDVIFYWPITVGKDNSNDEDWDIDLAIAETTPRAADVVPEFDLNQNDEASVIILDADAPAVSVCDRSEDVEAEILDFAADATNGGARNGTDGWDGNLRCGDITARDLGTIPSLTIVDDDGDGAPLEELTSGDFNSLTGLTSLTITGARNLPSGIFAGVGSGDKSTAVTITFSQNTSTDEDDDKVGNFKPSTIPGHIWDDQEVQQVIILTDDLNDDKKAVTTGLDAGLYAGEENGHFFVLTSTTTATYILGNSVDFSDLTSTTADPPPNPIMGPVIPAVAADAPARAIRFAVRIPNVDDEDKGSRTEWLFLFPSDDDNDRTNGNANVTTASDLKALATVAITDDD